MDMGDGLPLDLRATGKGDKVKEPSFVDEFEIVGFSSKKPSRSLADALFPVRSMMRE
jgi:hypothetical protein